MKVTKKRVIVISGIIIVIAAVNLFRLVSYLTRMDVDSARVISHIAYENNPHLGYTVYIMEDGIYTPYLVLSHRYNGHTLLLRKYLLDERMRYSYATIGGGAGYHAYYRYSYIDLFLEGEFFYLFSEPLQSMIVSADIEITARHSLRALNPDNFEYIERRVFLLSWYETWGRIRSRGFGSPAGTRYSRMPEGQRLAYFRPQGEGRFSTGSAQPHRVGTTSSGQVWSWWLRTPQTINRTTQGSVVNWGGVHESPHFWSISGPTLWGVRPAFRLPNDTPIRRGELNGEMVFFVDY